MMQYNDNPFKVLGVSPFAGRREIVRQAEERSLLYDADKCADARSVLTNPQKRLSAEIHWFLDCGKDEVSDIDLYISDVLAGSGSEGYAWGTCNPLTQLNIQLACISAQDFESMNSAKYYILGLSRLYEAIKLDDVLSMINRERRESGFPEVTRKQDVEESLSDIRSELRQAVSQKLQNLATKKYVQIVTMLSESYSGNERYKGHAVLEDLIADYQLFINDILQDNGRSIIEVADQIALSADQMDTSHEVDCLIAQLYDWDDYAQPLQLGALTKGSAHELSIDLLQKLRGLALKLHNQFGLTSESLKITKAVQKVFMELPEYSDLLSADNDTLTRMVVEQELEKIVDPFMVRIEDLFDSLLRSSGEYKNRCHEALISAVENASCELAASEGDKDYSDLLRSELFVRVRSLTIKLHNENDWTEEALLIMSDLEPMFSDIPKIRETIEDDIGNLRELKEKNERTEEILKGFDEIERQSRDIKTAPASERHRKVEILIEEMSSLDTLIKREIQEMDDQKKVRERLAYMVRSVGVTLHNEKQDSQNALLILLAVKKVFPDIPSLQGVLDKEILTLYQITGGLSNLSSKTIEKRKKQVESPKTGKKVLIAIAALAVIAIGVKMLTNWANKDNTSTSSSLSVSTSAPNSTPRPLSTAKPVSTPRPTATPQEMPASGTVFFCSDSYTPSTFTVENSGSSNYYMKFVKAGTDTTVITFFVRAHSTITINMPAGNLELRYAYGSNWYGEEQLFGEETYYAKDEEYYDFSNYTWEISLYTSSNVGQSMDVETIDADEF